MSEDYTRPLNPLSFLQAFIVQSVRVAASGYPEAGSPTDYVSRVGLAASSCLEDMARHTLGFSGSIDHDQYGALITCIKNQVGGQFERVPGEAGSVRVINHRCPFGDVVKEAPELCRMTSSVFGAVAARNFGYAKVEIRQRIAAGDGRCDVRVHLDAKTAANHPGDEYHSRGDVVTALSPTSSVTGRLQEILPKVWCSPPHAPSHPIRRQVVAESEAMRRALQAVEVVAPTLATVLITGETGVGKEVIARSVHALSERANKPFLAVNCGAIPENLVESALFGHEKGAFTDAHQTHQGFFERANGGTLFLDEIDSLPLLAQARLLRVLQEGEYERVGGRQPRHADVRIVAASNSHLERLVAEARFRQDLYYRINVVPIHIPPLRERPDDISALIGYFLKRLADKYQGPFKTLGERAWATALNYHWPGNLRELENALERAYLFAPGGTIESLSVQTRDLDDDDDTDPTSMRRAKKRAAMLVEARLLENALTQTHGNVSAVARQMGITPRAVHMKLRSHGIDANTYRKGACD